jgi:hypothetical protein
MQPMADDQLIARDVVIRQAAFDHIRGLQRRDLILSHEDISHGFMLEGERWPLWNPQRGIFKPRGMPFLLSIRTVVPRKGRARPGTPPECRAPYPAAVAFCLQDAMQKPPW